MSVPQVIVVGGGLSGLSSAHTVLERGGRVLLLEKNGFLGGNSTKATSGINGAGTSTQRQLNIPDSPESFYNDTVLSSKELVRKDLVKVLTYQSASAVEWLKDKFKLDLSLVSRLGGQSFPRTHRGKERFPGMTITYALMEKLEEISKESPDLVTIVTKARATNLMRGDSGEVIGIEFEHDGQIVKEYGPVVLCTGGYAADFSTDSLIKKYRPEIYNLPTTNGEWSTGDGIKMTLNVGGNSVNLEKIQVHPTGLVHPDEPDAKVKFLAAEALRGEGGLLLTKEGDRFCDELGRRDYVTGKMWEIAKPPYRLVLNSKARSKIEWHCLHYMGRGLMKHYKSGEALAKDMGISPSKLESTFKAYNENAKKKNCPFGKKHFHNDPFVMNDEFYVAIVTPVLHYTMGGVEIDDEGHVIGPNGPIPGLFAGGEIAGGVHGANRLGGSSLLDCVVFGRVTGLSAAKYLLDKLSKSDNVSNVSGGSGIKLTVDQKNDTVTVDISLDKSKTSSPRTSLKSSPVTKEPDTGAPEEKKVDTNKVYSLEEVSKHNTENDCWVIVNGQVLDVTKFLGDHPGGKKSILLFAGKDASEEFNMLHKPDVIQKYAAYTVIGKAELKSKL